MKLTAFWHQNYKRIQDTGWTGRTLEQEETIP